MRRAFFRKAHRWLGLLFSLSILTSAGSGILHNVMTYTQTPPPPARPSGGGLATEIIHDIGHGGYRQAPEQGRAGDKPARHPWRAVVSNLHGRREINRFT